jgi:hypothetical protein
VTCNPMKSERKKGGKAHRAVWHRTCPIGIRILSLRVAATGGCPPCGRNDA